MKKLSFLAAILAIGTMCITGCNMGVDTTSDKVEPQTRSIVVQSEDEVNPTPNPDDCKKDGDCHHDKMPHKKPGFKFKLPNQKHDKKGREKFRHPHKKTSPGPQKPETPEENNNN